MRTHAEKELFSVYRVCRSKAYRVTL